MKDINEASFDPFFTSDGSVSNQTVMAAAQKAGPTIFEADVPVRGAYLFADNDVAEWDDNGDGTMEKHYLEAPSIVGLTANGFKPGDEILIKARGAVHYAADSDWSLFWSGAAGLWAVFSSSNTVLWQTQGNEVGPLHRVAGAIDAGEPFESRPTFNGYPTDIPEDFVIAKSGTSIKIPLGAAYLMFSIVGSKFTDNDGWVKVTIDKDTDGDGLFDSWEKDGIDSDLDGTIDLVLSDADWQHKDIFVEVDYMDLCWPDPLAINDVQTAFRRSPVENPDGKMGIDLHVLVDQKIPRDLFTTWEDFDNFKQVWLGTAEDQASYNRATILEARNMVSHYCLFAFRFSIFNETTQSWKLPGNGGIGECPGNDFMVTLGYAAGSNPAYLGRDEQAATFMHELGHNLGLEHGGNEDVNYKPNYLSIMNYMFQFNYLYPYRPLDYSRVELKPLNEAALNEIKGLGVDGVPAGNGEWLFTGHYDQARNETVLSLLSPIDWDCDNHYNASVRANVNNCKDEGYSSKPDQFLTGYNDWENVHLPFRDSVNFANGIHGDIQDEITLDMIMEMRERAQSYHEVALINATASSSIVYRDGILDVSVNSVNLGANNETAELSVFAGTTLIAQRTITLDRCNITTTVLRCDVSSVQEGDQVISIRLAQVQGEEDAFDNNYTYGTIEFTGEAAPQTIDQTWLMVGAVAAIGVVIAIAMYVVLRKRGKKSV